VRRASNDELLARYLYDADNRRVRRTVTNGGLPADSGLNGSWDYAYLGWRAVEEREAASEEPLRQYVWGETMDELWTVDRGFVATEAELNDGSGAERLFALGTVMHHVAGLTDEEAHLIEAFEYTPYGRPTRIAPNPESDEVAFDHSDIRTPGAPSAHGNPFLTTGQRLDPETGWFYYKNRYHSPATGRFVSRAQPQWAPSGRI
jgi:RHS repeat-associated protein